MEESEGGKEENSMVKREGRSEKGGKIEWKTFSLVSFRSYARADN